MLTYGDLFKFYNNLAIIFRANIDIDDRAAHKVADRMQDKGRIISKAEEEYIKSYITKETKSITMPYNFQIGDTNYKLYLLDNKRIDKEARPLFVKSGTRTMFIPKVFDNTYNNIITVINKERFVLDNLYDNIDDKAIAIIFLSSLFREITTYTFSTFEYEYSLQISDILGLLFYYQATGEKITKEEYKNITKLSNLKPDDIFDLIEEILIIGEMKGYNFPLINENLEIQKLIAERISSTIIDSEILDYINP